MEKEVKDSILIYNDFTQLQMNQLLMILESNSHEFVENQDENQQKMAALYYYGSKVAHSCSPNLFYSCKNGDGCLRYYAISEIKEGEMITLDYVSSIELSRDERQYKLWNEKCFRCKCDRCSGPDDLRGFVCQCSGVLRQVNSIWKCDSCLIELKQSDPIIMKSIYQEDFIKKWMLQEKFANNYQKHKDSIFFDFYAEFYTVCQRQLSQTHILMINLMTFQNKIFQRICWQIEKEGDYNQNYQAFKQKSIDAGKQVLQSIECLLNKCPGIQNGKKCVQQHEPVAITAAIILYIYKQLLQIFELQAYEFGIRYLEILKMAYPYYNEVLTLKQQLVNQTQTVKLETI